MGGASSTDGFRLLAGET